MFRTVVATILNPRSGASDALGVLYGLVLSALGLLLAVLLIVLIATHPVGMEKELTRYAQAPEKSFAVNVAKFYKAIVPQVAFDAFAALPRAMVQPGEPGYKRRLGIRDDFENAKWGLIALYLLASVVSVVLQFCIIFGLMFIFAKVWSPLMWVPFIAAIFHYAMPLYLSSHFKYLRYMAQ